MPLYQGTHYTSNFSIKDRDSGLALNITGWLFRTMFRDSLGDVDEVLELTSANSGFTITDGAGGLFTMDITAAQSLTFPLGTVVFDVLRTDIADGPVWLFGGKLPVRRAVTRD